MDGTLVELRLLTAAEVASGTQGYSVPRHLTSLFPATAAPVAYLASSSTHTQ
jgi:hypothetical protein